MRVTHILLAGAAIAALTYGMAVAAETQTKAEEDAITRQLNLDQLAKARGQAPAQPPATQEGSGGPELQGPPTPEEGMKDDEGKKETMPPADEPATPPEKEEKPKSPPSPY